MKLLSSAVQTLLIFAVISGYKGSYRLGYMNGQADAYRAIVRSYASTWKTIAGH